MIFGGDNIFEKIKKKEYIIPLLLCVIALIFLYIGNKGEGDKGVEVEYSDKEAEKLEALLEKCEGVGEANVVISYSYFDDTSVSVFNDRDDEARIPRISGIGVVCEGGAKKDVVYNITKLISAAYNLPSHKIFVTSAK